MLLQARINNMVLPSNCLYCPSSKEYAWKLWILSAWLCPGGAIPKPAHSWNSCLNSHHLVSQSCLASSLTLDRDKPILSCPVHVHSKCWKHHCLSTWFGNLYLLLVLHPQFSLRFSLLTVLLLGGSCILDHSPQAAHSLFKLALSVVTCGDGKDVSVRTIWATSFSPLNLFVAVIPSKLDSTYNDVELQALAYLFAW